MPGGVVGRHQEESETVKSARCSMDYVEQRYPNVRQSHLSCIILAFHFRRTVWLTTENGFVTNEGL